MLRRSILELSSRQSSRRIPAQITTQIPSYLFSRRNFSVSPQQNVPEGSGSAGKPSESGSSLPKFIVGGVAIGAVVLTAYQTGYLDKILGEQKDAIESAKSGAVSKDSGDSLKSNEESQKSRSLGEQSVMADQVSNVSSSSMELAEDTITHSALPHVEGSSRNEGESKIEMAPENGSQTTQEKELPSSPESSMRSDDASTSSKALLEASPNTERPEVKPSAEEEHETAILNQANVVAAQVEAPLDINTNDIPEDASSNEMEQPSSLFDAYYLRDDTVGTSARSSEEHEASISREVSKEKKDAVELPNDLHDAYISNDGKLVLDFLQAIHTAEKRQFELDARTFAEEKRKIKEKFEKELKDARAKELMYAEEVAMLDKELSKERIKATAALKSLQEKLEEKLKTELEQQEAEAKMELEKTQELAKAELAAAIASEKASQIEKMAEANLHINALCMAFYARSEEARQSHSVHKLALGALALEDALSKGLPIQREIDSLHTYLEGIDNDSLLGLVLSSLPEETRIYGTDTLLQLNRKFDALKGTLRHFSLIPPGGSGILAHSVAHVASWLKVKEADQSGDGIESLINRVESFLAEGKISEAADALEEGVKGTQAAEIIGGWVQQARNRAITEQALTMIQSYATSIAVS